MQTGLIKRRDSKLLMISTAAAQLDSPLGRMRARALAQPSVKRTGAVIEAGATCTGSNGRCPTTWTSTTSHAVKRANPAPWITARTCAGNAALSPTPRSRSSTPAGGASAKAPGCPPGAWQACVGEPAFEDGEDIWIGVDVGGERSATAVAWVNRPSSRRARIYHGDSGVLEAVDHVRALAAVQRPRAGLRPVAVRPSRAGTRARRISSVAFPQHDARMIPAAACTPRSSNSASPCPMIPNSPGTPRRHRPPLPPRMADRQTEPPREHRRDRRVVRWPSSAPSSNPNPSNSSDGSEALLGCGRLAQGSRLPGICQTIRNREQPVLDAGLAAAQRRLVTSMGTALGAEAAQGTPRRLQAHHDVPRAQGGPANVPANLVTLCASCHGRLEAQRRARDART